MMHVVNALYSIFLIYTIPLLCSKVEMTRFFFSVKDIYSIFRTTIKQSYRRT